MWGICDYYDGKVKSIYNCKDYLDFNIVCKLNRVKLIIYRKDVVLSNWYILLKIKVIN